MANAFTQRLFCLVGKHRRDGHRTKYIDGKFRSVCLGCKTAMSRGLDGWHID